MDRIRAPDVIAGIVAAARSAAGGGGGGAADPDYASVAALLHFNGTNGSTTFTDEKGGSFTATTPTISTAQSQFGGASGYFTSPDAIYTAASTAYAMPADWTIELWVRPDTLGTRSIVSAYASGFGGFIVYIYPSGIMEVLVNSATVTATHAISTGVFSHLAVTRQAGTIRLFVNGVLSASGTNAGVVTAATTIRVGYDTISVGNALVGYYDDLRYTRGVARYTASFTPPVAQFPDA